MKLLDRYILTTYLKTFFSVFIILMLIFVLQSVWLYITELAGKDLEIDVIIKFLIFVTPRLVVLVLPLTILLSSIMVFGGFAENYEFAAMKSTGVSLQRAMRSLSIFIIGLSVITFFFANNIIPAAELNFHNLRRNIAKVKPAMIIAEGQFNQIGNINIKVDKKSGDRGQYLDSVLIHQKKGNLPGNHTVYASETGELTSSEDSDVLQLVLHNGNYYDDLQPKELEERRKVPNIKSSFETLTLNIDLAEINNVDFDEQNSDITKYTMLGVRDLNYTIDSLNTEQNKDYDAFAVNMYNRSTASTLNLNIDPVKDKQYNDDNFLDLFDAKKKVQLLDLAINSINSTNQIITIKQKTFFESQKKINKHVIALHEKFALAIACIILFFIGAPLGALIKKGGIGLPIIIAISFFLTYHFIGIFAKNSAEDDSLNPLIATWLSTVIMLPISIYLTSRATKDRSLLDFDSILQPIKRLVNAKRDDDDIGLQTFEENSSAFIKLNDYSDNKLIDLLKNYRQYDLDRTYKNTALQILNLRGITEEELRFGGNLANEKFESALRYKNNYEENSRMGLFLYIIALIFDLSGAILNNNGFPSLGKTLLGIGILATILYLISFVKTLSSQSSFYKVLGSKVMANSILLVILGIPLYYLYFIYFNRKMKEDLKEIR
ncbi:MAG: LptF/LptG family permease [Flavobacteriaceae bacterium]|nr:LptF/LptG family permease [Flavobacteriaceae bacterium]